MVVDLLTEIRDLLVPIADAYRGDYERRENVRRLVSSSKQRLAWDLADGSRTQQEIVNETGIDKGQASRFFKALRSAGALTDSSNPKRSIEI